MGESQARNRYAFYAKVAKKEGFEQIAEIFNQTAEQEKTHSKRLFEHIQELKDGKDEIIVETSAPTIYGNTIENLKAAIAGETHEYKEMYPEFAKIARDEDLAKIGARLEAIAKAEEHHAERYIKLLKEVEGKTVFKKEKEVVWICRECGYVHVGQEPPQVCPACDHASAYYELKNEEY